MKRILTVLLVSFLYLFSNANEDQSNMSAYFFGPNALQVLNLHSGETSDKLNIEISSSYYKGNFGDISITPNMSITIPLFTRWVNLHAWASIVDFYYIPENAYSHFTNANHMKSSGAAGGDIYVSSNIQIAHHSWWKYLPDAVARIGIKTASGGGYKQGRYMDSPGYFFDINVGREITIKGKWAKGLRLSGTIGFLCWQTGTARQNDAYTYGLMAMLHAKYLSCEISWAGYSGWMNNKDEPMSFRAKIACPVKNWEPYVAYQYGIRDYSYQEFRIGLSYSINILKQKNKLNDGK